MRGATTIDNMKKVYWIVFGIVAALLLTGTFWDLQIAGILYNHTSAFGEFFAVAAMVPIWTLVPISAGLMFGALITCFDGLDKVRRAFYIVLLVFGVYATYERAAGYYGSRHLHGLPFPALVYIIIAAFLLATALGAYSSRKQPQAVLIAAIVGIIAVAGGRLLLDALKDVWGRQRYWTMDDAAAQFTAWYQPQFPDAARTAEMGDKIRSFPSGHSFGAISMLWLSMFPAFLGFCRKNVKAWSNGAAVIALCFWSLVMVSRLILGEHFLSDVSMSAIIFLAVFIIANAVSTRFIRKDAQRKQCADI